MLCICAAYAYACVCLSVRLYDYLSVTFIHSVKMNRHIFKNFSPSSSHTILVFLYQMSWLYFDGEALMGASNAAGVGKSRDSGRIFGYWMQCEQQLRPHRPPGISESCYSQLAWTRRREEKRAEFICTQR